jgi:hypothetical protein
MKRVSRAGLTVLLTSFVLMLSRSQSLAAASVCMTTLAPPPTTPVNCSTGQNLSAYRAGGAAGVALVDQIWTSNAVNQDPNNWGLLKNAVDTMIPSTAAAFLAPPYSDYVRCRAQGLLEGTTCEMKVINPASACALDGFDWGIMSAQLFCHMSEALNGLGSAPPWFIRPPVDLCGAAFQATCEDTYHHIAENTPLGTTTVPANRTPPDPDLACPPYTRAPYDQVFDDSVYIDCTYDLPPPCTPTTCAAAGAVCGSLADGCGGTLACGSCASPLVCGGAGTPNQCGCSTGTIVCGGRCVSSSCIVGKIFDPVSCSCVSSGIHVVSANNACSCSSPTGNMTEAVSAACNGTHNCVISLNSNKCSRNSKAVWTCGTDPSQHTSNGVAGGGGYTMTLTCP